MCYYIISYTVVLATNNLCPCSIYSISWGLLYLPNVSLCISFSYLQTSPWHLAAVLEVSANRRKLTLFHLFRRPVVINPPLRRLPYQHWKIFFTLILAEPPSCKHTGSLWTIPISRTMSSCSSHPGVLPYAVSTSWWCTAIFNHTSVSPMLPKNLTSHYLLPKPLGVTTYSRLSTLLHWRFTVGFQFPSASRSTFIVTVRRPADFYPTVMTLIICFSTASTSTVGHTLLSPRSSATFS